MKTKHLVPLFLLVICSTLLAGYTMGVLTTTKNITSGANLVTSVDLSVYESVGATEELVHIDWETILPTETKEYIIWVQNDADIPMLINITTTNWLPVGIEGNLTFTTVFPVSDHIWQPHDRMAITLSLTASADAPATTFSFTIQVSGTST